MMEFKYWKQVGRIDMETGEHLYCPFVVNAAIGIIRMYKERVYDPAPHCEILTGETVVDIGTYIGGFAIYAAGKVGPTGRVISFEPLPHIFEIAEANRKANKFSNFILVNKAIGDRDEIRKFYYLPGLPEMGYSGKTCGPLPLSKFVEAESITLESAMRDYSISEIDFLKLNCEGAEGYIIPAIRPETWKVIRKVIMQVHDGLSPVHSLDLIKILVEQGFSYKDTAQLPLSNSEARWVYFWKE